MSDYERNEALELFKRFCTDAGLMSSDVKLQAHQMTISTPDLVTLFTISIPMKIPYLGSPNGTTNKPHLEFFKNLYDGVHDSDIARRAVEKIEANAYVLNAQISTLQNQVQELTQYKIHHDLEMELRHGKKRT